MLAGGMDVQLRFKVSSARREKERLGGCSEVLRDPSRQLPGNGSDYNSLPPCGVWDKEPGLQVQGPLNRWGLSRPVQPAELWDQE